MYLGRLPCVDDQVMSYWPWLTDWFDDVKFVVFTPFRCGVSLDIDMKSAKWALMRDLK